MFQNNKICPKNHGIMWLVLYYKYMGQNFDYNYFCKILVTKL